MTIDNIKSKLKQDCKRYKTLEQISKDEDYKLAYSMIADYLEELVEEVTKEI